MIRKVQDVFKNNKQSVVLYNVVLPLIFVEVWSVFLAFIAIVIIETLVIKTILKERFEDVIKKIICVNFLTTVIGYLVQGIVRLMALLLALPSILPRDIHHILWDNEFVAGFFGNVGSTNIPSRLFETEFLSTVVDIATSFIITFIISVVVETRSLRKAYDGNEKIQRLVPSAVLQANIISYFVLLMWVSYYIKNH